MSAGAFPRVTIGPPVYNGERFVAASLDALLAQILADLELIISDNASTDGTKETSREYAAKDARIRFNPTAKLATARWEMLLRHSRIWRRLHRCFAHMRPTGGHDMVSFIACGEKFEGGGKL